MSKSLIIAGITGLLLRLLFMPISLHADLLWVHSFPTKLAYSGVLDIYGFIKANFSSTLVAQGAYYYGPLAYLFLGIFHFLIKYLVPGVGVWLGDYLTGISGADTSSYLQLFNIPQFKIFLYLFILKLPYLLLDFICLWILINCFQRQDEKERAFKLWMLNPVIIFGSYIFGQLDICVTLFLLLSMLLLFKERYSLGMIALGASALIKSSPLVLILPLALITGKSLKQSLKYVLLGIAPILVFIVPLYLKDGNYILGLLFPPLLAAKGAKPLDATEFMIGKFVFTIGYLFLVYLIVAKNKIKQSLSGWHGFLVFILLSYFVIYTPIHYFQWVVPFLIIAVVTGKVPGSVYFIQMVFLFIYAINSRPLSAQLLLPLNTEYFYNMISLPEYMNQFVKWGVVMHLARWGFHACSFYIIGKIILKPEVKSA